jgi:8-oxo-dGTP diphosphatase
MIIGLQSSSDHIRPDSFARSIIKERTSTIFPAPCRQAVYAPTVAEAYVENERVLGKKFTPLTVGILPKMREIDAFLQKHPKFKNVIKESHPEVCFAKLNRKTVLSKKSEIDGMEERIQILSSYIEDLKLNQIAVAAKEYRCNVDDVIDAICLAVTANIVHQGEFMLLPEVPMEDETGILMQMVIPR